MKQIKPSANDKRFPRCKVSALECRKRDLVLRITDWTKDRDEPAYDVEVYIGGVYDWNESASLTFFEHGDKVTAKRKAIEFAQRQIEKLL